MESTETPRAQEITPRQGTIGRNGQVRPLQMTSLEQKKPASQLQTRTKLLEDTRPSARDTLPSCRSAEDARRRRNGETIAGRTKLRLKKLMMNVVAKDNGPRPSSRRSMCSDTQKT
jgi:hypothetical protein